MNILLIGPHRHGKDTLTKMLEPYNVLGTSSSLVANEIFIFDALKDKYDYLTKQECFEDRVNHRDEWFRMIVDYNTPDAARLARDILQRGNCYIGMRSDRELQECKRQKLFGIVICVFNPNLPPEPSSSFDIDFWRESDIIVPNSGTLDDLQKRADKLGNLLI